MYEVRITLKLLDVIGVFDLNSQDLRFVNSCE